MLEGTQRVSRQTRGAFYRPNDWGKNGRPIWVILLINEVKHGHLQRPSKSCQRFQCRDRVPILYTRDMVAKQTCALLHVDLRKRLVFAPRTQSLADDHFGPLDCGEL